MQQSFDKNKKETPDKRLFLCECELDWIRTNDSPD